MILILIKNEAAIILKIWREAFSHRLARFAIRVIVDSGLLNSVTSIVTFGAMVSKPDSVAWITHAIVGYS